MTRASPLFNLFHRVLPYHSLIPLITTFDPRWRHSPTTPEVTRDEMFDLINRFNAIHTDSPGRVDKAVVELNVKMRSERAALVTKAGKVTVQGSNASQTAYSVWVFGVPQVGQAIKNDPDVSSRHPIPTSKMQIFEECKDGLIPCKPINDSVPDTIHIRVFNKPTREEATQCLSNDREQQHCHHIGCSVVNIGSTDITEGCKHLILGLVWQIIRRWLLAQLNINLHPELYRLSSPGGSTTISKAAGWNRRVNNFSRDAMDGENHTNAAAIGCHRFLTVSSLVAGNPRLNLAFVANLFKTHPGLGPLDEQEAKDYAAVEDFDAEGEREARVFALWLNSLGVEPGRLQLVRESQGQIDHPPGVLQDPAGKHRLAARLRDLCLVAVEGRREYQLSGQWLTWPTLLALRYKDTFFVCIELREAKIAIASSVADAMLRTLAHSAPEWDNLILGQPLAQAPNEHAWRNQETPPRVAPQLLRRPLSDPSTKSSKNLPATLQAGFNVLQTLLNVLPWSLGSQVPAIIATCKFILSQSPSTTTSTLHLSCLPFIATLLVSHSSPTFATSLSNLTLALLRSLGERHLRIASETFRVFSALLNAVNPIKGGNEWLEAVYEQSFARPRLTAHDTDTEVRACAEPCIGDLWIAPRMLSERAIAASGRRCAAPRANLTEDAVKVVTRVAKEVPIALALSLLALLLELAPKTTFPGIESDLLPEVHRIAHLPLVSGVAINSLLSFIAALINADDQIGTYLVPNLVIAVEKAPTADSLARATSPKPSPKPATVVSAIRYTFAETSQSYHELLVPLIVDFLSIMLDKNITVRCLALSTLNSAARSKPHLIRQHLTALLLSLYKETVINVDLIRTVQMGPWTHKVDDGLDARKAAYETMYTLLDTCLSQLGLSTFFERVLPGLADDSDEVKVICHMMLFRLSQVASAAVSQKVDEATPELEKTMKGATVTKDMVKQCLERAELRRSALRVVAALSKVEMGVSSRFDALVEEMKKSVQWAAEFKEQVVQRALAPTSMSDDWSPNEDEDDLLSQPQQGSRASGYFREPIDDSELVAFE
ncbi:Cullin-associated nedd8-dissociated protein 1 [Mycena kentingensis (nom. inval.)]|nr:Cullin-associated nedd8-dissociated protein 1 [Mycena kentingensis (nom. inval.)]